MENTGTSLSAEVDDRLVYSNIFDAITDDSSEAAELKRKSDILIAERKGRNEYANNL